LGGEIDVWSEPGEGAGASFTLRRSPPALFRNRYEHVSAALRRASRMGGVKQESKGAVMSATTRKTRELASRESDGLAVVLLWDPRDNAMTVSVADSRTGDRFELAVDGERALDAFYHPFVYAA